MELEQTKDLKTNLSLEKYPLVEIKRTFSAPIERVWKAWSEPELIKQWWGPQGYSSPSAKIDFRVGGKYLLAMQGPDGKIMWSGGTVTEIIPNKKIGWTDHFADQDGNPISPKEIGMTGDWPEELYITVEFNSRNNDQTEMTIRHEGIPKEMHDDCVTGWSQSIDKLQTILKEQSMMKIQKEGSAIWQGTLKEGGGTISTQSGALNAVPYGFNTRFAGVKGSNPEELLGATHASCFTMALSLMLNEAGYTAEHLETKANVTLEKNGDAFEISAISLTLRGKVPGLDQAKFQELADKAKTGCPISKALKPPITLDAQLV